MSELDYNRAKWEREIMNHRGVGQAPIVSIVEVVTPTKEPTLDALKKSTQRTKLAKLGIEAEHKND